MCPESFDGVRFDIILCMSRLNHVPSGDTLHRDAISSLLFISSFVGTWMYFNLVLQSKQIICISLELQDKLDNFL